MNTTRATPRAPTTSTPSHLVSGMTSSLGDIGGQRPPPKRIAKSMPSVLPPPSKSRMPKMGAGVLPVLLLACLFGAATASFCYYGIDADYTETRTRGLTGGAAGGAALLVLAFSRNPVILFYITLFVHIGLEIFVVDKAFAFASASNTKNVESILAYTGAGVVIAHLVPFLLFNWPRFLMLLALVGVVVNNLLLLLSAPELGGTLLLPVGLTSVGLLGVTQHICYAMRCPCSLPKLYYERGLLGA